MTVFFFFWKVRINSPPLPRLLLVLQLRGKLLIKRQFDPLDVMAQLDGRPQLQVHALLHRRQIEQEKSLSVDLLREHESERCYGRSDLRA